MNIQDSINSKLMELQQLKPDVLKCSENVFFPDDGESFSLVHKAVESAKTTNIYKIQAYEEGYKPTILTFSSFSALENFYKKFCIASHTIAVWFLEKETEIKACSTIEALNAISLADVPTNVIPNVVME